MVISMDDALKHAYLVSSDVKKNRQDQQNAILDALTKKAQLSEAGYDINGQDIVQRPDFVSAKAAQSRKDLAEASLAEAKLKRMQSLGGGAPLGAGVPQGWAEATDPSTGEPKLVRDYGFKRLQTPEERMAKVEDVVATKEMTSQAEMLPKLDRAAQAVNQLQALYGKAFTPTSIPKGDIVSGIQAKLSGIPKSFQAATGANPELNRYSTNREAFAGLISKGGFGETGVLTNQDIKRITKILPNEYSTKEESDIAWQEINTILSDARKRFEATRSKYANMKVPAVEAAEPQEDPLGVL